MHKVAVVVQRYGEEVNGGAELHARWLAEHLKPHVDIEVITTCAVDYYTWENTYPPGTTVVNGVQVHRFPVDKPRASEMEKRTAALLLQEHSIFEEHLWVKDQGPYSTPLFDYLIQSRDRYEFFIFFTYLYATTFFGLPLVSDKSILVPTAHEEPYVRLPAFRPVFHLPQVIVYNTETEKNYVNEVTGNTEIPGLVAGIGIDVPENISSTRFRNKFGLGGEFILYIGRVDKSKNVHELIDYFIRFREVSDRDLKLVLMGKVHLPIPSRDDILPLGFLPESDKFDGLGAASLVVVPSLYESLSMVTLEGWLTGKPVLVNGRCAVLKNQCQRSNGGLYYFTYDEFAFTLTKLIDNPKLREKLGHQGRAFVRRHYDWEIIVAKYLAIFETLSAA